jgi:hypothetical protein
MLSRGLHFASESTDWPVYARLRRIMQRSECARNSTDAALRAAFVAFGDGGGSGRVCLGRRRGAAQGRTAASAFSGEAC